eukprot:Lithocolla_globosa_v1_NODE_1136_length_2844_cov_9.491574.p2 type:complete len:135 gc:universal NODE_1136_length_2844_cov_9.491574:1879-2283(+)
MRKSEGDSQASSTGSGTGHKLSTKYSYKSWNKTPHTAAIVSVLHIYSTTTCLPSETPLEDPALKPYQANHSTTVPNPCAKICLWAPTVTNWFRILEQAKAAHKPRQPPIIWTKAPPARSTKPSEPPTKSLGHCG